ncbi:MAG: hypothetical protein IKE03_01805 [Blautia sp.]|nr:hypothetical protein [Blautia sp.]
MAKEYQRTADTSYRERDDFDERWERMHREKKKAKARLKKSHAGVIFLRIVEFVMIGLSLLASSRIARFITAKLTLDSVVVVTSRFGPAAGHNYSTILAAIAAEPKLIAVIVTGVILLLELIALLIRAIRRPARRRAQLRQVLLEDSRAGQKRLEDRRP